MSATDCRTPDGVTVGLIDSIITMARLLAGRDLTAPAIREALEDLRQDEDVARVIDGGFERGRKYGAGELIEWAVSVDLPKRRCRESKPHFSHTWVEGETTETHLGWQCPGKVGV